MSGPQATQQEWSLLARLSRSATGLAQTASRSLPPDELQQFAEYLRWLADVLHVETADEAHPQ